MKKLFIKKAVFSHFPGWKKGIFYQVILMLLLSVQAFGQTGLNYEYYEGAWSTLPDFDALTPVKSSTVDNFDLSVRNRNDNFGFKFSGYVNVPSDGAYTFYTSSDDGSKLYIGSTEVVANDGLHGTQERSGSINLTAGKHAITVTYFEATGGEILDVSYSGPNIAKQVIPASALFRSNDATSGFSGTYKITARHSGKALDVSQSSTTDGANIQQWSDNGTSAQQWNVTATTNGYYKIVSKVSSKAMEVGNNSIDDGGNVQQWTYIGSNAQQWKIEATTDGYHRLINRHSGKALDVEGVSSNEGANVHQWTYGGGNNQQWKLEQLSGNDPANVTRELWSNISGTSVSDIPLNTSPTSTSKLTSLEAPTDGDDNYGARIRGYIIPVTSGSYTFYIAGDDNAQVYLSSNDQPVNKSKIAEVPGWTSSRQWDKYPSQQSATQNLIGGNSYYFEILHKEGGGGDNLAVGWTGPEISAITVIDANYLSSYEGGNPDPTTYTLTISSGTGGGSYEQGEVVNIAAIVPNGHSFSQWTGDIANVADVNAANTTVTMPAGNITISATFTDNNPDGMATLNVGMNINSVSYYGKQNAFKNMAKQSSTFQTSYDGGPWNTEEIANIPADINGYPLELPYNGNVYVRAVLPFYYPEGTYVLTYDGEGEVKVGGNTTVISSSPGRIEFDYRSNDNGGLSEYKITKSMLGNNVRNIVIVPIDMEGQDVLTNPFRDDFLEYLKPMQAIRYMGFMHINGAREQVEWTDRSLVEDYTYQSGDMDDDKYLGTKGLGGVPIEVCVQLNNILQNDAWFCVPHPASDDYIRQYARLVKEKMNTNLKTYIEYSNEIWNWAYAFPQSNYIINNAPGHPNAYVSEGLAAISPEKDMHPEKDAYMIGRTMRLWSEEWAGQLNRLVRVAAVQHGWVDNTRRILEYLKVNNQLQLVDAVSPAGYFGLTADIRDNLNARGAALTYQEVVDGVIETFETEEKPNTLAQAAYAKQYGKSYVAYEGGSHVDYRGGDTERFKELIKQFDDSQEVYDMYKRNYQLNASPEVDCKLFINLAYVGEPGGFGHLEYLGEPLADAPKYRAILDASPSNYIPVANTMGSSLNQAKLSFQKEFPTKKAGVYPNPARDRLFIVVNAGENEKAEVIIRSLTGVTVKTFSRPLLMGENIMQLNTSELSEGVYVLTIQNGNLKDSRKILIHR